MAIVLKKVQRINPQKKEEPMKWYGVQKSMKKMTESEVAELVADETTLNPAEALMAIRQLRKVVQRTLLGGQSVQLGDWGSFNVRVSTTGAETQKGLTAANVRNVRINFQPGSELKAAMQKASFVWADELAGASSDSASSDSGSSDGDSSDGGTGSNPL